VAECTTFPQEVCNLRFSQPKEQEKPLKSKWCLDPTPAEPGEQYDESNAQGEPLGAASTQLPHLSEPDIPQQSLETQLEEEELLPSYGRNRQI
jgi:hypothetical protein